MRVPRRISEEGFVTAGFTALERLNSCVLVEVRFECHLLGERLFAERTRIGLVIAGSTFPLVLVEGAVGKRERFAAALTEPIYGWLFELLDDGDVFGVSGAIGSIVR